MTGPPFRDTLLARFDALRRACEAAGCTGRWLGGRGKAPAFEIAPPATPAEVDATEAATGRPLPVAVRRAFLEVSRAVRVEWELPDGTRPPAPLRRVTAGECRWNLGAVPGLLATHHEWLEVFPNRDDWWDEKWHGTFPVLEVGNGDMLAVDLDPERTGGGEPIVYLSHDGDDALHGRRLAADFVDYLDRLTRLGCPGSEDWRLAPFVPPDRPCLDPDGPAAVAWRAWFGLNLPDAPAPAET